MKLLVDKWYQKVYDALKADENIPIELRTVSKAVENAQKES